MNNSYPTILIEEPEGTLIAYSRSAVSWIPNTSPADDA